MERSEPSPDEKEQERELCRSEAGGAWDEPAGRSGGGPTKAASP